MWCGCWFVCPNAKKLQQNFDAQNILTKALVDGWKWSNSHFIAAAHVKKRTVADVG
jgi:hypothetical protein